MRPSACRRMRVVRWSILKRSSSTSGSVARRSASSSTVSWRCSSDWLRLARLRNMSLTPWRTRASSTADLMAVCRTASIAWPTWPISSLPTRIGGASAATSTDSPRRSRATTDGSCSSARVSAERRSVASRLLMDRPSRIVTSRVRIRPATPTAAVIHTRRFASIAGCALASRTVVAAVVPAVLLAFSQVLRQQLPGGGVEALLLHHAQRDAGRDGLLDGGQVALDRRGRELVDGGVVGRELGRGEQLLVGQRVVLLPPDRVAERHPVGAGQRPAGKRARQHRVLLGHVFLRVDRGDQAEALQHGGRGR